VCFQLIQSGFYLPSLVVQGGQFFSRSRFVIKDSGDQSITRFGVGDTLKTILDHSHPDCVALPLAVLHGGIKIAEERSIG
jgi:hypothetical protein